MSRDRRSILFIENMDLASPLGCTVPYYLTDKLSEYHTVHVVCRKRPERRDNGDVQRGIVFHDIDTGDIPVVSGVLFVVLSTLYSMVLCLRYRYDVVYTFQHELIQGWIGATFGGSKLVVGLQSVPVRQEQELVNRVDITGRLTMLCYLAYGELVGTLLSSATEVICLTEEIRTITAEEYGVDMSDATVIGMGVDVETFTGNGRRRDGDSRDHSLTLTYVGSITESRGLDHVIEAIAATDHDIKLRIAGTGSESYVRSLKTSARELGVADRVEWLGLVPHTDIPELLDETDIAISPLADIEAYRISFPAKLLEYMAAECIVIATDIPPHQRLIDDGRNGFLYDAGTSGFLKALERYRDRRHEHSEIRRQARETAERYSWDAIIERHEQVICR